MIDGDTALAHHLFKITAADAAAAKPSDRPKPDLARKWRPLESNMASSYPCSHNPNNCREI